MFKTSSAASTYGSIAIHQDSSAHHLQEPQRRTWKLISPIAVIVFALALAVSIMKNHTVQVPIQAIAGTVLDTGSIQQHTKEYFYDDQLVDHHNKGKSGRYTQRYYQKEDYFGGPGSPIFVIFGGEDPLDNLLYPFVYDHLAKCFNAHTFALEHRFFGTSMPVANATHAQLFHLLSPNQAMWDAERFIQHKRRELGCSLEKHSRHYCPVISVGGSYPGFLSGLMRFAHPDVVDISYASSAPFDLYAHKVDQGAYYEKVTVEAERMSPGCASAVREALLAAQADIVGTDDSEVLDLAVQYGICRDSVPQYIQTTEMLSQEIMLIIATHFAESNMGAYPPSPELDYVQGCHLFQDSKLESPAAKIAAHLTMSDETATCFDMMTELPPGVNGTISASDWSGVGSGPEGYHWEFLSCTWAPELGMTASSMFPPRPWSLHWETQHCLSRFDDVPNIHGLNNEFGFNDRSQVQRLLLTNGLVDGWSIASVLEERADAPGVKVVNMINGAHHTDLSHTGPSESDTPDVKEAYVKITAILDGWLGEMRSETK